ERDRVSMIWTDEPGKRASAALVAQAAAILRRLGIEVHARNGRAFTHPTGPDAAAHRRAVEWMLHPGVHAWLCYACGLPVGVAGEVHPDRVAAWDLSRACTLQYAELFVDTFPSASGRGAVELPRFPSSARDLSLECRSDLAVSEIVASLRMAASAIERDD